ncbi:MAG: carboxyl-terminal processing protease [Sulfitobacter sp.]|jgi:carboxyl-terminal processing protease
MKRLLNQIWIVIATFVAAIAVTWVIYMPNGDERGVWRAQTGGTIISLTPFTAKMYSETSVSCLHQLSFPAHMKLVELTQGATVSVIDAQLHLNVDGSLDPMILNRIDALPDTCGHANPDATPRAVFDTLWSAMDAHYAFFDLHGVNWDARRAFAPALGDTMTDSALLALLSDTLQGLDDAHVQIGAPIGNVSPAQRPDWLVDPLNHATLTQIARDTLGMDLTTVDLTGIEYALLADGVGYVLIRHMDIDTPFGTTSQTAMALTFAQVADAMTDANSIIIDLRYNPGGSDSVSFGVASHFVDTPLDVFTKTTRDGSGQSAQFTATLHPFDATPLMQPVIVLTSQLTGSAAEILTMALRELPQVTTVGQTTSGGLSDILGFKLANGWDLGLSHQTYRTLDGQSFEAVGIPPDIAFPITATPLLAGVDPLLRAAFVQARSAN